MIDVLISGVRIFIGLVFILFLPGFSLGLVMFRKKDFDIIKRIAISPVLSVIIVFFISLLFDMSLGIDITGLNIFLGLSCTTVIFLLIWGIQSGNLKKSLDNLKKVKK